MRHISSELNSSRRVSSCHRLSYCSAAGDDRERVDVGAARAARLQVHQLREDVLGADREVVLAHPGR
jgi:hypothetical protein